LEQEIQKVHRAQEELVASCERRERLERVARARLQSDCRRIQEINRALREQLDMVSVNRSMSGSGSSVQSDQAANLEALKRDVGKREVLIAQLITQSKLFCIPTKS
jgi:4-diphosphocytidyl-2C-methyl-D-erythritol kinase